MKVLTFTPEIFARECRRLERLAGTAPDLVVGIASGGVHVAERIFPAAPHVSVSCRRPSTATKTRMEPVFKLIRLLPLAVRDRLRVFEATRLRRSRPHPMPSVNVPDAARHARDILVVDDAVDSGATMRAVTEAIRTANPGARIRTAAITVTTPMPLIWPDMTLYTNVLIRFPWARDYR